MKILQRQVLPERILRVVVPSLYVLTKSGGRPFVCRTARRASRCPQSGFIQRPTLGSKTFSGTTVKQRQTADRPWKVQDASGSMFTESYSALSMSTLGVAQVRKVGDRLRNSAANHWTSRFQSS